MRLIQTALFAALLLSSQSASALSPAVGEIKDNRSTGQFFNELEIEIKMIGDDLETYNAVRPRIDKAVDDTGKNLVDASKVENDFAELRQYGSLSNTVRVKLKNPSRKAMTVAELKGNLEFYNPALDPNATVKIANVLSQSGKPLTNPALKSAGISLTIISAADYKKNKEAETKKAQDEARKQGMSEEMIQSMAGFMGGMFEVSENSLMLELEDPAKKIVAYKLLDASGKEISRQSTMTSGNSITIDFDRPVPADASFEIQVLTDKSLAMVPINLTGIALP